MTEWTCSMYATLNIFFSELWNSLLFWSCGCRANQQYHSGLRGCLPVSVRASTRGKDDLSVWWRWEVEPRPCYLDMQRQGGCSYACNQIALLTYWLELPFSCSKLWSSKTSSKWNYCKLYQYSGRVNSGLPV